MKHRSITLNYRQKDIQWNGIIQIILCSRSLWLTLQLGKFMFAAVLGCRSVFLVDIVHCGETTSSDQILAEAFQESSA
jgi:hypothetical protein